MNFWQRIPRPIVGLSPMDGVTDASFRYIVAKHGGPDVILTEFVNVETALYAPHTLLRDLTYSEIERPVVAQIYGHTPELFYKVAHIVGALGFDGLDINMGCPAKKVAAKGSGAALILAPDLARAIIRVARDGIRDWSEGQTLEAVGFDAALVRQIAAANRARSGAETPPRRVIPVSVKTRLGYDDVVVERWIRTLLEEKPAAISLHGRTLKQQYSGSADWTAIARAVEVARDSDTLILGNGDLRGMDDVCRRARETGVGGVLVGRAAQGDPWIFRAKNQVKRVLALNAAATIERDAVTWEERFSVALEHSRHFVRRSEPSAFAAMRKHLAWYCKSMPRAAELRRRLVQVNDLDDVTECLRAYAAAAGAHFDFNSASRAFDERQSAAPLAAASH
jgi:tRNA-dihydrouridine synthase